MSTPTTIAVLASYFVASGTRRNGLVPALFGAADAFDIEVVKDGNRWGWIIRFEGINVMTEAHPDDYNDEFVFTLYAKTKKAAVEARPLTDAYTRHCIAQFFAGAAQSIRYGEEIVVPVEVVEAFAARFIPAAVTA
jgi:hypothetical protein